MIIILPLIAILFIVYLRKSSRYGCDCRGRDYELVREASYNKYYKCTKCGTEDYLITYRHGNMWINERMKSWYFSKCIDDINKCIDRNRT